MEWDLGYDWICVIWDLQIFYPFSSRSIFLGSYSRVTNYHKTILYDCKHFPSSLQYVIFTRYGCIFPNALRSIGSWVF
jgi:hypothetical protein